MQPWPAAALARWWGSANGHGRTTGQTPVCSDSLRIGAVCSLASRALVAPAPHAASTTTNARTHTRTHKAVAAVKLHQWSVAGRRVTRLSGSTPPPSPLPSSLRCKRTRPVQRRAFIASFHPPNARLPSASGCSTASVRHLPATTHQSQLQRQPRPAQGQTTRPGTQRQRPRGG